MNNNKIGRNNPCPCGSGKKYKKCCLNENINKKERFDSILFEDEQPVKLTEIKKLSDGTLKMFSDNEEIKPKNTSLVKSYKRDSGKDKILNQIKMKDAKFTVNQLELLKGFDIIFAVDTNTKDINNSKISVVSAQCCEIKSNDTQTGNFQFYSFGLCCIKNIPDNRAEKFGIKIIINQIQSNPKYKSSMKVALISDHDLDKINKYNNNELPIFGDFYLPDNFTLLYASADKKNEGSLLNILISNCDTEANKFFEEVKNGKITPQEFRD